MSLEQRLWSRVVKQESGCWEWTGNRGIGGRYGGIRRDGRTMPTHRLAYELLVGPIPEGLELDHLCRNTICCNPDHLEPVTHAENMRRGEGWAGGNARKTQCERHGLALTVASSGRVCRECRREDNRRYRARLRAAGAAA